MPGHKPAARGKGAPERNGPHKKRPHGFARPRTEPARRVVHAPESCPECHTALAGGWVQRTREVIDLPVALAEVTEHVFPARTCPLCRKRRLPQDFLPEIAVGRQRLGVNLVSLIVALREEGRLPVRTVQVRTVQWHLGTVHQLKLSVGAIVRAVHQVTRQAGPEVGGLLERIRSSPVVHAGETGWRQDGVNGYAWTFSTPSQRYFLRRGRGGEVVDEVLGESFEGILVSDFYAAYHHYPWTQTEVLGLPAAGHSHAEGIVPGRCRACPVGKGGKEALRQGPGVGCCGKAAAVTRAVGPGAAAAGAVPSFPGRPAVAARETVPADRTAQQGTVRLRIASGYAI